MAITRSYAYSDDDFDTIEVSDCGGAAGNAYISPMDDGVYVTPKNSVPLALHMLGHDRPVDEPVSTGRFEVGDSVAFIPDSNLDRNDHANKAAALLMAVDAYDQRQDRLATAEKRREAAAKSLTSKLDTIEGKRRGEVLTGDQIGLLREALGRYDAELAN